MATLGSLVVSIEASVAKFESDLGKAVYMAEQAMGRVSKAVSSTKSLLNNLIGSAVIYELGRFAVGLVDSAARLAELHTRTGASVEALSAMSVVAHTTGTNIEDVAGSFDKLQKNALTAQSGTGPIAAAFRAVGFGAKDLAAGLKEPDKLFLEVAQRLSQFRDDGNKTAVVMQLMGKSGDEMLAFLKQFAIDGYAAANVTAEQAEKAHDLEAGLSRLNVQFRALSTDTLLGALPTINKLLAGVELFGVSFLVAWEKIKINWTYNLSQMAVSFKDFIADIKNFGTAGIVGFGLLPGQRSTTQHYQIEQQAREATALQNSILDAAAAKYVSSTTQPAFTPTQAPKPSLTGAVDNSKALRRALDETLKILEAGLKAEQNLWKLNDATLDQEYSQALISLSDFAESKQQVLAQSFDRTLAIYDQEIATLKKFIATQGDAALKSEAMGKLAQAQLGRDAAITKNAEERLTVTKELQQASEDYAKSLVTLEERYATLNNDTVKATELQIAQDDGMLKARLTIEGNAEAVQKLVDVENDLILRARQDPISGIRVGITDWVKQASNAAEMTKGMVTNFLDGMTNALVTFVQTGKLNFRSLINSMIADLARLIIEQQLAGFVSSIGSWFGGIGAASAGSSVSSGFSGPRAGGGPVSGGSTYLVGEKGPELFVPDVSGSIVPNGAGGGVSLNYAPVIHIDSRSDRSQVQADIQRAVRQGSQELVEQLLRYNRGLRV